MTNLDTEPCDIQTIIFDELVVFKCKVCGTISTKENLVPCERLHEIEMENLHEQIRELKLDLLAGKNENSEEPKIVAKLILEHKKLKSLIGLD